MHERVGFIGLGAIGAEVATHLLDWPGGLVVFDIRPEAMERFRRAGADTATSAGDVGRLCTVISVMVLDDEQVRDVVADLLTTAAVGTVIAIHSTISPTTAVEMAALAVARGVVVFDVPVTGGRAGAVAGTLAAFVGGPAETFERVRPVLDRWSTLQVHVGAVGAGTRAKLARNLIQFVGFAAAGEARRLAAAAGIDLAEFTAVVRHSDAVIGGVGVSMIAPSTEPVAVDSSFFGAISHMCSLGIKDLDLALECAKELGVETPLTALARRRLTYELGLDAAP